MSEKHNSKELIKGTGIYAIGTLGSKILSFIFVPIYTYYIAPADMGTFDILMSTMGLISPLITLQIADAAYRWIIRDEGNNELYIRTTLQTVVANCLLAIIVIGVINRRNPIPYCTFFSALLFVTLLTGVLQKILRGLKNQKLFVISGLVHSAVYLLLNIVQICVLHKGINSLFISSIIAYVVASIVIIVFEKRTRVNCIHKIHIETLKNFLHFSVPLIPNYLNWWVINSSDKYIVSFVMGISANGILAIAHKFPTTLNAILSLFNVAWQDVSVSEKDENENDNFTAIFRNYYQLAFSFLWILIPLTKVIVYLVMSPAYKSASNYIAFYYLGTTFQSFSSFYGVGYLRNNETGKAFSTSVYAAIINICVNLALIRFIGVQAAAVSTFISFFIMWLIREKQNRKELGIKINWKELLGYTAVCIVISVVSILFMLTVNIWLSLFGFLLFFMINWKTIVKSCQMLSETIKSFHKL